MKRKQKKWIKLSIITPMLLTVFAFSGNINNLIHTIMRNTFFPGPLSATAGAESIQGYSSHAEFEQECGHCHAPVHCISDTHCQDCHMEIAQERITASGLHSRFPGVDQCEDCHKEHLGREASITEFAFLNIDHELMSGFSLEKHNTNYEGEPMNCESCHGQKSDLNDTLDCISCHIDENHDQIAGHIEFYGTDCVPCHDGHDRMITFEHAQVYPLDGEHANIECETCHAEKRFAGVSTVCSDCHEEPEVHAGIFGFKCERCHTATAWLPAELTLHTFLVDHGEETLKPVSEINCENCHVETYTKYPCYSCHDQQEMIDFHAEIDIEAYENCIDCHPTGREGEADDYVNLEVGMQPIQLKSGD
jgi:hypothetical protein